MDKKILFDSPEAAQFKKVEGWVSADGFFCGKDERSARYSGCTHRLCECGKEIEKRYSICDGCSTKKDAEKYLEMPFKEWDGEQPVVIYNTDQYFFSGQDLIDWVEDNEVDLSKEQFCLCRPEIAREIEPNDYFCDELAEDGSIEDDFPGLAEKFQELNKYIREEQPILSWWQSEHRTRIDLEKLK